MDLNKTDQIIVYTCIQKFSLPYLDSFEEETGEYFEIEVNSIWNYDSLVTPVLSSDNIRLESEKGWIEISDEMLQSYFEKLHYYLV